MLLPRRWENGFCRGLWFTLFWLFCTTTYVLAQYPAADTLTSLPRKHVGRPLRVAVDVNWTLAISATQLFKDYQFYLGGRASGFDIPTGVGLSIASYQFKNASIGLGIGYNRAAIRETYEYNPETRPDPIGPAQTISQTLLLTTIPALVTIDYHPLYKQFTGYVGGGIGVSAINMFWQEALSASAKPGARASGIRYDKWQPTPLVNIHAGVSLGFDQLLAQRNRPGIFIEVAYQWMPITAPFFEKTGASIATPVPALQQDYTIHAGGFVLRAGFEIMLNEG